MKRILLLLMIKNEETIIERCIRSAVGCVDAICLVDTGSTDKTHEVSKHVLESIRIPTDWNQDEWKHFGHNRSLSFQHAVEFCDRLGWKRADTYALLLDADMKWKVVQNLHKDTLSAEGYTIQQRNGNLSYFNVRLIRLDVPWKCIGATHEYWSGGTTEPLDPTKTYIEDVGDGGCKADKFERDIRLLTRGLEEDSTNGRYMFYLAQSYKDTRDYKSAIAWYKKRIQTDGWFEEVWYSHYMIAVCHKMLGNELKMEYWANRAFRLRPSRAEPLYMLTQYYREKGDQWRAFMYWRLASRIPKTTDSLFVEEDAYGLGLDYEFTILCYYVYPNERKSGLFESVKYVNANGPRQASVYFNSRFYLESLKGSIVPLRLQSSGDYVPSSISCLRIQDRLLLNVRYVNYRIQPDGSYKESLNGTLVSDDKIRTRNAWKWHDTPDMHWMDEDTIHIPRRPRQQILGLEDVRLFSTHQGVQFVATSPEYSYCDKYRIIAGHYDYQHNAYRYCETLRPPTETPCEKNWIPSGDVFLYTWHPLQVGALQGNQLVIVQEHTTPRWFQNLRGSSNGAAWKDSLCFIVHGVYPTKPRIYFHQVILLNKDLSLHAYSLPFYFQNLGIEYCLGLDIQGSEATAFVSSNDSEPFTCSFSLDTLSWV